MTSSITTIVSSRGVVRLPVVLLASGYLLLVTAAVIALTGGASAIVLGVRLSATRPAAPAIGGALLLLIAAGSRRALLVEDLGRAWDWLTRNGRFVAIAAAIAVFGTGVAWGTYAAAASDASGYISQASLLAHGTLEREEPLGRVATWPDAAASLSPLGYRPGRATGTLVPTYPPGLPLTMAPFIRAGGEWAAYLVVPLLGAVCVLAAWRLGSRWFDPLTGVIAAVWLATSPILLFQVVQPMSDVPAAAWWTLALLASTVGSRRATVIAGLAAGAALLTRPNLGPPIAALVVVIAVSAPTRARWRRMALFGAAALPAALVLVWWQFRLYGTPFTSGYGSFDYLFDTANVLTNTQRYATWLTHSDTPLIWLAIVAPWIVRGTPDAASRTRWLSTIAVLLVVLIASPFLAYAVFDNWTYARFLLPALPLLIVLSGSVIARCVRLVPPAIAVVALAILLPAIALRNIAWAQEAGAFRVAASAHRYVAAGRYVAEQVRPDAVVVAGEHSGSIGFYTGRSILRWDVMQPQALNAAVAQLAITHPLVFVLDDWEEQPLRARHASLTPAAALDWPPVAETAGIPRTRVYIAADQGRYATGAAWLTRQLP